MTNVALCRIKNEINTTNTTNIFFFSCLKCNKIADLIRLGGFLEVKNICSKIVQKKSWPDASDQLF